jgi:hypothetical protein
MAIRMDKHALTAGGSFLALMFAWPLLASGADQPAPAAPAPVMPVARTTTADPLTSPSDHLLTVEVPKLPTINVVTKPSSPEGFNWSKDGTPIISATVTIIATILALFFGYKNTQASIKASEKAQQSTTWQKVNEAELKDLQTRLDGFYAKFQQLSEVGRLLSQELRSRQPGAGKFFLMDKLFDKVWRTNLSPGDKTVLAQIISNGKALEKLILENSSGSDAALAPYFARAIAHFRMLRLAHDEKLGEDPKPFAIYLYPRQLNNVLQIELTRISQRQSQLRQKPGETPGPMPALNIPDDNDHKLPAWPEPPIEPIDLASTRNPYPPSLNANTPAEQPVPAAPGVPETNASELNQKTTS